MRSRRLNENPPAVLAGKVKMKKSSGKKRLALVGQKFGRLTVKKDAGLKGWECLCLCGKTTFVITNKLRSANTRSCGCFLAEVRGKNNRRHGMTGTRIYKVWCGMLARCNIPSATGYEKYGARGITVCKRWLSFENFYADMGDAPAGLQIERKDNSLGYSPENCTWGTVKQQALNRRSTVWIEYNGKKQCRSDWAREIGITEQKLTYLMKKGLTLNEIFTR